MSGTNGNMYKIVITIAHTVTKLKRCRLTKCHKIAPVLIFSRSLSFTALPRPLLFFVGVSSYCIVVSLFNDSTSIANGRLFVKPYVSATLQTTHLPLIMQCFPELTAAKPHIYSAI